MRKLTTIVLAIIGIVTMPATGEAQRERDRGRFEEPTENVPYDGRFTFVRIRYDAGLSGDNFRGRGGGLPPWAHDYPRGERNFTQIVSELSTVNTRLGESIVLTLDDPELFKYPVAYMAEPGFWSPKDSEIAGMRAYLQKGGFFIFDDFQGQHWFNFEMQMRRVLPGGRLVRLSVDHPIFDSFYKIETLVSSDPVYGAQPEYYGIFEDNDTSRRLMVIVNYNQDLSEYWEWSDMGYFSIDLSNEAYKLGVNYIIYALSR